MSVDIKALFIKRLIWSKNGHDKLAVLIKKIKKTAKVQLMTDLFL